MVPRRAALGLIALITTTSACSLLFQNTVREHSVYCDTSPAYAIVDAAVAAVGVGAAIALAADKPYAYAPSVVLAGSTAFGWWRRGQCIRFRASAPPEEWAKAAVEEKARRDEAGRQGEEWRRQQSQRWKELGAAVANAPDQPRPNRPSTENTSREPPPPAPTLTRSAPPPAPNAPPASTPQPPPARTVVLVHHTAADEAGKACTWSEGEYPTAHECQYGAVCYRDRCTTWCGADNTCPSGYRCGEAEVGLRVSGICLP